jgi:hypothetical protein
MNEKKQGMRELVSHPLDEFEKPFHYILRKK